MNCLILVPIYQPCLPENEKLAFDRLRHIMKNHPISFLAPEHMREFLTSTGYDVIYVSDECMDSRSSYNRMFLSTDFYAQFTAYEYVLICQLDVWIFYDSLVNFIELHYDYIGSPSIVRVNNRGQFELYGGNGGFSLRRVEAFQRSLLLHQEEAMRWSGNEDEFFSYCGENYPQEFRVAPKHVAMRFAFDRFSRYMYRKNREQLPMGWHGWLTYDPELSRQLVSLDDMEKFWEGYKPNRTYTDVMKEIHDFVQQFPCLYIYGAGLWGKTVFHYLKEKNIAVKGFIVSDDQSILQYDYQGIPIYHLHECLENIDYYGIIFSISKRYLPGEEEENLCHSQSKLRHLLCIDAIAYNGMMEELLKE